MGVDKDELLSKLKELLKGEVSTISYDTWFAPLGIDSIKDNHIVFTATSEFQQDFIENKFNSLIFNTLRFITNKEWTFSVIDLSKEENTNQNIIADKNSNVTDAELETNHQTIDPKYTFETFVVGNNNRFAHAAALAVGNEPGESYNPLFLYGGVGLGKTHLMQAIGNRILENNPKSNVLYVTSEKFTNQLINAIRDGKTEMFRNKYRNIDVLLIDDIQFIIGKESTQEEFFHTFNALHSAGKQIILTSDKPPKDMETLEDRIRSRFEWGLIADIGTPDYETRMAILRRKVEADDMKLSDEILNYIATNIKSNIRELEGALNKLLAYSNLEKTDITMEIAMKELQNIITPDKPREITPQLVIEVVTEHFNISLDQMISKNRSNEIARPRQIAMYLCKNMTDIPLDSIGQLLGGRDHSTIIHGIKKIADEYESNENTRNLIETIKKKINPN